MRRMIFPVMVFPSCARCFTYGSHLFHLFLGDRRTTKPLKKQLDAAQPSIQWPEGTGLRGTVAGKLPDGRHFPLPPRPHQLPDLPYT